MMSPVELRARRELLHKALTRLITGTRWPRSGLFASTSAQSAQAGWQRLVLRQLIESGLVLREGPVRSPMYYTTDFEALTQLAENQGAIDLLLREAMARRNDREDSTDEGAPYDEPDGNAESTDETEQDGADVKEHEEHILKLVYMTAEAVGDVRERLQKLEQKLDDLNKTVTDALWLLIDAKTKKEENEP